MTLIVAALFQDIESRIFGAHPAEHGVDRRLAITELLDQRVLALFENFKGWQALSGIEVCPCIEDAILAGDLRGKIEVSTPKDTIKQEHAKYRGTHFVECFVIKNQCCVASAILTVSIG